MRGLRVWEELVGRLEELHEVRGGVVVTVSDQPYLLLNLSGEFIKELESLQGERIGILRTDDGYRLRRNRSKES